jgi:hypothetical protein
MLGRGTPERRLLLASCRTCQNPQVERINALLAARTPIRRVSQNVPRSSLARHAQHVPPNDRRLGLVPPGPPEPDRIDPLTAGVELLERAMTERERLKALEQVRAATYLALREMGNDPDEALLERMETNVRQAEEAFRGTEGFEQAVRSLQGIREALAHKLAAARVAEHIDVALSVTGLGLPAAEPQMIRLTAREHFRDVPRRFRDARYGVSRIVTLALDGKMTEVIEVREGTTLAWTNQGRT